MAIPFVDTEQYVESLVGDEISQEALDLLYEYSNTVPTGVVAGRVWKRNIHYHSVRKDPVWVICEYVLHSGPVDTESGPATGFADVEERRPVIVATTYMCRKTYLTRMMRVEIPIKQKAGV